MAMVRHSILNLIGAVTPLAVILAVTPLYISTIGAERYGILAIFSPLLNSLAFISLGIGPAADKRGEGF